MAADLQGFTEQEALNKVLNTDNNSLQVDIVDATGVTITTSDVSVYVDDATWTDDESSHTLLGGVYQASPQTITDGKTGPLQVDADGALHISDGGNVITVDGTVSVSGLLSDGHNVTIDNASSNEVYVRGSGTAGSADTAVLTVQGIASGVAQPISTVGYARYRPDARRRGVRGKRSPAAAQPIGELIYINFFLANIGEASGEHVVRQPPTTFPEQLHDNFFFH